MLLTQKYARLYFTSIINQLFWQNFDNKSLPEVGWCHSPLPIMQFQIGPTLSSGEDQINVESRVFQ